MAERRFSVLSYPLKFFSGNIILTDYTRINSFWQSLFHYCKVFKEHDKIQVKHYIS